MKSESLAERVETAIDLMYKAGREALRIQRTLTSADITQKTEARGNVVTKGDLKVKEILVEGIKKKFPSDSVYSEESLGEYLLTGKEYSWGIDEIDGTIGYQFGFPEWGVSTGLRRSGVLVFGAIYFPALKRFFQAQLGKGAFENGRPIHTNTSQNLYGVIAYTAGPHLTEEGLKMRVHASEEALARKIMGIYREPCGTLTMARIARGEIGLFLHTGTLGTSDDLGAGPLIIKEAGGVHSPIDLNVERQPFLAASSQIIYDQVVEILGSELINKIGLKV